MKLASIDIGSNGARLLIKNFRPVEGEAVHVSREMYMRIPLRLGADVFTLGKISKQRAAMMKHMLKAFRQILKLNDVDDYRACATSAMRDAENGRRVLKKLRRETGINLEIIDGKEEAILLYNNIVENAGANTGNFAYIDVGGGSTEISLLHDGTLVHSHSYNIGTLRILGAQVGQDAFQKLRDDLRLLLPTLPDVKIIGSGGNINKLFKLAHGDKDTRCVSVEAVRDITDRLRPLSAQERMEQFALKSDRADVIVPAAEIFLTVAEALECHDILVPGISLADSIVDGLYWNKYSGD